MQTAAGPGIMLVYRTGLPIDASRLRLVVLVGLLFLGGVGFLALSWGASVADLLFAGVGLAVMLAVFALAFVLRRRVVVQEARLSNERLELRVLGQGWRAGPVTIPLAETSGWADYIEVLGGYTPKTRLRIIAFVHRGRRYGMPIDPGAFIDEAFVTRQLQRGGA